MRRGFLSGERSAQGRAERVRAKLQEAEEELRSLRKQRVRVATESKEPCEKPASAPWPAIDDVTLGILAAHEDPPDVLHRLAQALMLLLEAGTLVGLGDHELPVHTSWRNLQLLLRRSWDPVARAAEISQELSKEPFGRRLAEHVRQRILGMKTDGALLRNDVEVADPRCACVFDYVEALSGAVLPSAPRESERARIADAVTSQEREVGRLRKELSEVQRSDEAAQEFAKRVLAPTDQRSAKPSKDPEVVAQHSLQYRLNEVAVPPLQEMVLKSLVASLKSNTQVLTVTAYGEVREEPETGTQRAEAVQEWLLAHGVPLSQLQLDVVCAAPRGSRRVVLNLCADGTEVEEVKDRSAAMVQRLLSEPEPRPITQSASDSEQAAGEHASVSGDLSDVKGDDACLAAVASAQESAQMPDAAQSDSTLETGKAQSADPPTASIEEVTKSGERRTVRVVFASGDLSPKDTAAVARDCVRLESCAGKWAPVEVSLPFPVVPTATAKFSRRAGTLTITLEASSG